MTSSAANVYGGTTTVGGGTLLDGVANALPTGTALSVSSGAKFDLGGFGQQVSGVTGNGTVTNSSATASVFTIDNASTDVFPGLLTGNLALTKSNAGILTLSSANSFSGQTVINAGTLSVNKLAAGGSNSSLGSASTPILLGSATAATLSYTGSGDSTNRAITINGAGGGTIQATTSTLTLSGGISTGGNPVTFDANVGNITETGDISGGGNLTKSGSGTLDVSAANVNVGNVSLAAGTLLAPTSGKSFAVAGNWTNSAGVSGLNAGTGTATFTSNTTQMLTSGGASFFSLNHTGTGALQVTDALNIGGTLSPNLSPGLITVAGALNFAGAAENYSVTLAGAGPAGAAFSQTIVGGGINLNSALLSLTVPYHVQVNDQFVILRNTSGIPIVGTFNGLPNGATFLVSNQVFKILYNGGAGNDVVLLAGNHAPAFTGNATLAGVLEDTLEPAGATISSLIGAKFSDPDAGQFLRGVAIVGNTADAGTEGTWQYSSDSGNDWFPIGSVSDTGFALVLSPGTRVRFVPTDNYDGINPASTPPLFARALDNFYPGNTSTTTDGIETRVTLDTTVNGGTTFVSGSTATLNTSVISVADTPTVTGSMTSEGTQTSTGLVVSRNAVDGPDVNFFQITNITGGTLFLNNGTTQISNGNFITYAQANAGLKFTPSPGLNGLNTLAFGFDVQAATSPTPTGLGAAWRLPPLR